MEVSPFGNGDSDSVAEVVKKLTEKAEAIGLYAADIALGTPDKDVAERIRSDPRAVEQAVRDGDEPIVLMATFTIGDLAFSKRVQDPEQYEFDTEAAMILPDDATELKEKLRRNLEEGKGIFDE